MENATSKVSCFARAYHHKNNRIHIFDDSAAELLLGEDYNRCNPEHIMRSPSGIEYILSVRNL